MTGRRALIVTLGRARGSLAAARALHRAGWTVGVGTPDGGGMVGTSSACSFRHHVPRPRGEARAFLHAVTTAVEEVGYDVVFGGGDDWMAALSYFADRIPTVVPHPRPAVVARALDKAELGVVARQVGLAAPATEPATAEALERWHGPVVIKCRSHWTPGQRQVHRVEARLFPTGRDAGAQARLRLLQDSGLEAVLQQPVPGGLGALVGLVHEGRLTARQQQVTHALWPTPSGVSARASTVAVDPDLAARAEALLVELGWTGLVELQFLTGADGVPHLIDLNGRFYGSMALADAARPGLADAWGRQALGLPVPTLPDARPGVRFAWAAGDLRRATVERRGGLVPDVGRTLAWAAGAHKSVWSRSDVGPTWHLVAGRLLPGRPHALEVEDLGDLASAATPA